MLLGVSCLTLALSLSHISLAQDLVVPPEPLVPGTTAPPPNSTAETQARAAQALNAITQAVGGNNQTASLLVQYLGGDAIAAADALTRGNASAMLANALGSANALSFLTGALGSENSLSAIMGALGGEGSLNALIGSLGGEGALNSLVGGLLGNNAALSSLQNLLGGNQATLNALSSLMSGNMGALSALTGALGGMDGALSALTGALGIDSALSALTGALGVDGALAALSGVLGIDGALSALTGLLGDQVASLLGVSSLCGIAPLTGTFAVPGCIETKDTRAIVYAKQKQGGGKVAEKINQTMNDRLGPAMKDQAAQLHAGTIDQTRVLGSVNDAAAASEAGRDIDGAELAGKQAVQPHDQTCALPTAGPALATTAQSAAAITRGLTNDAIAAANPVEGTVAAAGPAAVYAARFDEYCQYFKDPEANNGSPGCEGIAAAVREEPAAETPAPAAPGNAAPAATPAAAPAAPTADAEPTEEDESEDNPPLLPNGDIDVENILLRDTIELEDEYFRKGAQALLRNLVAPKSYPPLPEGAEDTAEGQEWIVRKERVDTLRRISADVVSGMIARRTAIEIPDPVAAGWVIPPAAPGPSMGFDGQCYLPNTEGNANASIYNRARARIGEQGLNGLCQRFVREVSRGYLLEEMQRRHSDVILQANRAAERSVGRQMDNEGAIHAITAWALYRHMGVATPCASQSQCIADMRPGDLVYMRSQYPRGRLYGHTGIYAGANQFISALSDGIKQMPLFGPGGWETLPRGGEIWGFVRPSGVSAQVADCGVPTPGQPETLAEGTGTPAPSAGTPAPAPTGGGTPGSVAPAGSFEQMLQRLAAIESGGQYNIIGGSGDHYIGKYQMGRGALMDATCVSSGRGPSSYSWRPSSRVCSGVSSTNGYLQTPVAQERSIDTYMRIQAGYLRSVGADRFKCTTVRGAFITPGGMLCAAHNLGAGDFTNWLRGRHAGVDGFGTKVERYLEACRNYDSKYYGGACDGSRGEVGSEYDTFTYNPPPPRPVNEVVREIRVRAGIPPEDVGANPSYNEIMLAMTKERFFDPRYFADLASNMGAMQQNESALNAYISMTLQDIHLLQEQINALAAAKASIRIERGGAATNEDR